MSLPKFVPVKIITKLFTSVCTSIIKTGALVYVGVHVCTTRLDTLPCMYHKPNYVDTTK